MQASCLGIGVTGHRPDRLADSEPADLKRRIEALIASVASAAGRARPCRVVSSLADGADALVADAALAAGWPLDAVLPFAREDYAADFGGKAARMFEQLGRARSIFELPGSRHEVGGPGAAYERAGRIMLAQSDVLIAIWDGEPPLGRGGTAQIVAEAVAHGIPVVRVDPVTGSTPVLLWAGLDRHEWGPDTVDTVARGGLDRLPELFDHLTPLPLPSLDTVPETPHLRPLAAAYPLLLAVFGVRRLERSDWRPARAAEASTQMLTTCLDHHARDDLDDRLRTCLAPGFTRADTAAAAAGQTFRSAYVGNFTLAAFAVLLSLFSLMLPSAAKPALLVGEFVAIAVILLVTRKGGRADWHRRWLDNRRLAERLRCLSVSAQLGDLTLRAPGDDVASRSTHAARAVGRAIGLPSARMDAAYLHGARAALIRLLAGQIDYLSLDASRMHKLEHRLHRLGTLLFMLTATVCLVLLLLKASGSTLGLAIDAPAALVGWLGIAGAALPTVGAAIYGIRMQGDFAGVAVRNAILAEQLKRLHLMASEEAPHFDTLWRLTRRTSALLTQDVTSWFQAHSARPLRLPG